MTQTHAQAPTRGGQFLTSTAAARGRVRPRGSDRRAAAVRTDRRSSSCSKEVLPVVERLVPPRLGADARAAEEGERSRSAAPRDSAGLRRPRARSDQRVVRRRADRDQPVVRRIARRAHVDRHAAARLLRQRRAEGALPAAAGERRADRRLRADRAAVGIRRARGAHHRDADRRRPALRAQRPEDVDHQRRLRRPVHDLREGRRRQVHRVPRRARHGRGRAAATRSSSGSTARRRPR